MSAAVSRILGWSPPDNEDFVDVPVTPSCDTMLSLQNPTFHISESNPVRRLRRTTTGIFHAASPASSTSEHSSDEAPADKPPEGNGKNTDPAWVARPRNEFILFRCDYVRKHSREGKRVRRAPGTEAEKTLSKQAAEAWHHLPPEERLYWKERANGERNEHARRYPDYRYRPKKSATGRRRQTRCSSNADGTPTQNHDASEPKSLKHPAISITRQTSTSSKGTPRRYASVPELSITEPIHRRLRSTASHGWIGVASSTAGMDHGDFSVPSREVEFLFFRYIALILIIFTQFTPMPQIVDNAPFEPSDYFSAEYVPSPVVQPGAPPLQSSSSLLNWNGARMISAPLQPTQFLSSTSVSICSLPLLEMPSSAHMLAEYTTGGNPEPVVSDAHMFDLGNSAVHYTTQGDIWMSQLELQYPSEQDVASRVPPADEVVPEPIQMDMQESSSVASSASSAAYSCSNGATLVPQVMVDYGQSSAESIPVDLLGSGTASNQENLYAMDTDEFFNHNF
ncbi:hypothetical protein BDN70DRAFT_917358 [Pholiota conissans]|uniref:HMG box domain-containing protein n=1 Tax=Pholiota conissans TaxID=109636 RepID=A0A9P6CZ96_9AGAR|nr:hypothetical protein BDN70DRAFT_917358 [Pholiota conissans]